MLQNSFPLCNSDSFSGFLSPVFGTYSQTCVIRPWLIRLNVNPAENGLGQIFYNRKQYAHMANPAVFNPPKNSPGTNGGGLTRSDCTSL